MFRSAGYDLAVDLGTATTRVHATGRGVVFNEPTVAAVGADQGVAAVGAAAVELAGRSHESLALTRALAGGGIADFDLAERMLRYAIERARPSGRPGGRPRLAISVASTASPLERRALTLVAETIGLRDADVIEPTVAAARGIGVPMEESAPTMVGVLGAGVTEVAVLAGNGVVASSAVPVGGDAIDGSIAAWLRATHSLLVGDRTAEKVKTTIGTAWPTIDETIAEVRGRDLESGLPRVVKVTSTEVRAAMSEPVAAIAAAARATLDRCPPELATDVTSRGLTLAGGGALLTGLAQRLRSDMTMPVTVAERPLDAVVLGAARLVLR